ncbi:hypothetical protein [Fibrella forsythiae]|uniref:Uncharacterized protein n=1 Tax=Fibrella forsythiae TaxID=2817061 RepID=A0ABS3JKA6_9BACT|nr:hypothetical protein [Fibrella forsythiae]MBO0950433.1 hypothetical protein [Fibrella forsythiae]
MNALLFISHSQLEAQPDKDLISLDKASSDREWLVRFVVQIRIKKMVGQLDVGEEVEYPGEQSKADW